MKEKPPQEIDRILGQLIREHMGTMTHQALSDACGIPRSTLTKLLNGKVPYLVSHLEAIAAALRIPAYKVLDEAERLLRESSNVIPLPTRVRSQPEDEEPDWDLMVADSSPDEPNDGDDDYNSAP